MLCGDGLLSIPSPFYFHIPRLSSTKHRSRMVLSERGWCLLLLALVPLLFQSCCSSSNISVDALDSVIRDSAFRSLLGRLTGVVYEVSLPTNLSGVAASVIRVRTRSFYDRGTDVGAARIPPRTLPVPSVRRLVVVHQNLGNWSFLLDQNLPDHNRVSSVISLLAYDASDVPSNHTSELGLKVDGAPISVIFPEAALRKVMNVTGMKCARIGSSGGVQIGELVSSNMCLTTKTGHFAIVVPTNSPGNPPGVVVAEAKGRRWRHWVTAFGVILVVWIGVFLGVVIWKARRRKMMMEMGRKADEGDTLETVWIGSSRMPSATMVRTQPVIENETTA